MKTRTLLKSRRGISPILATLLLIVIAVAAIVVTYAWIMIYMRSAGHKAGIQLNIEAISWPDSNTIKLYVRNTGTSDATIGAVYIGTSPENLAPQNEVAYNPANKVVRADGGIIEITVTYQWEPQTTYHFKVVSSAGPFAEGSAKSPASP